MEAENNATFFKKAIQEIIKQYDFLLYTTQVRHSIVHLNCNCIINT